MKKGVSSAAHTRSRIILSAPPRAPNIMIFGLFPDNLNISEQTIDSVLTTYTEL